MSRKDSLKEELGFDKQEYQNYFVVFLTIISATFTSFYQVILGSVPAWIAFIGAIGFTSSLLIAFLIKRKRAEIDKKLQELEEME